MELGVIQLCLCNLSSWCCSRHIIGERVVAVDVGGSHADLRGTGKGIACLVEGGSGRAGAAAVSRGDLRAHLSRISGWIWTLVRGASDGPISSGLFLIRPGKHIPN